MTRNKELYVRLLKVIMTGHFIKYQLEHAIYIYLGHVLYPLYSCDVRYDFRITNIFDSSLPPVVCRRAHVSVVCVCLPTVVSNTSCGVFVLCFSSSCC